MGSTLARSYVVAHGEKNLLAGLILSGASGIHKDHGSENLQQLIQENGRRGRLEMPTGRCRLCLLVYLFRIMLLLVLLLCILKQELTTAFLSLSKQALIGCQGK